MPVYTPAVEPHTNQPPGTTDHGWVVWQVIDSAFPVGGFAHSGGLEAATQLGFIQSPDDLLTFVRTALHQSAKLAGPFVIATSREPDRFDELNRRYDVLTINAVANAASRAQGAATLSAGEQIFRSDRIVALRAAVRRTASFAHLPHAFAILALEAKLDSRTAVDAFFYQQARSLLSAAVRLSAVGPMEAQRLLVATHGDRATLIETALQTSIDDAVQTAPAIDLLQSLHERLYSRLFIS